MENNGVEVSFVPWDKAEPADRLVRYMGKEISPDGGEWDRFVFARRDKDGALHTAMEACFRPVGWTDGPRFLEKLERTAQEPWFLGRVEAVAASVFLPGAGERVQDDMKELAARLSAIRDEVVWERETGHSRSFQKSGFMLKPKVKERIVRHFGTGGMPGTVWVSQRDIINLDHSVECQKDLYADYWQARKDIKQQFLDDMERYGKHLSPGRREEVEAAFVASLEENGGRHPHYEIDGSFTNNVGRRMTFHVKAEVYAERVLLNSRSQEGKEKSLDGFGKDFHQGFRKKRSFCLGTTQQDNGLER